MANRIELPDGTVAVFDDHLSPEEVDARVKSHMELAALGLSRSPRALPVKVAPSLPVATPKYARTDDWEPPPPGREQTWAEGYLQRQRQRAAVAFDRVYGRHIGRR